MNNQTKALYIDGEASSAERSEIDENMEHDPQVFDEIVAQLDCDRALGTLLGSGAADESVVASVRQELANAVGTRTEAEPPRTGSRPDVIATGQVAQLVRIAAMFVVAISAGLLCGRFWPSSEQVAKAKDGPGQLVSALPDTPGHSSASQRQDAAEHLRETLLSLHGVGAAEMVEVFLQLEAKLTGRELVAAKELLIYRWAELDPSGALAFLLERDPADGDAIDEVATLFSAWVRLDPEAAVAASNELEPSQRNVADARVFSWLAENAPEKFVALAREKGTANLANWTAAFTALTERGENIDAYLTGLSEKQRALAIGGIAGTLVARGSEMALAWARDLEHPVDRKNALRAVLDTMGRSDPEAAGAALQEFAGEFPDVEGKIALALKEDDPFLALDWIQTYASDATRPMLYRKLALGVARDSDNRVFDLIDRLVADEGPSAFRKDFPLSDIFWGTDGLDYPRAVEWAKKLPKKGYAVRHVERSLVFCWANGDKPAAIAYTANIADVKKRAWFNSVIVSEMISTSWDYEKTWEFASSLPPDRNGRDMMLVLEGWARTFPEEAASRIGQLPANQRRNAISKIAAHWGATAPDEAVVWAATLTDAESQRVAFARIASAWGSNDSLQASQWISGLDGGVLRDAAVEQLVGKVAPYEGDSAFVWAVTIEDPQLRQASTQVAIEAWAQQGGGAARAGIESSTLPASEKQTLLNTLAEPGGQE